jgi:hypothetical protein
VEPACGIEGLATIATVPSTIVFCYTIMHIFLIIICGLIIGHLIKKCNHLEAENRRFKSMPPLVPMVDLQYLQRYRPVAGTGDDEAFMFPSPEGAWVRWRDVAKPQPTGGRLIKEPRP